MTKLYHIQISPHFKSPPGTELFSILEQLLPINFIFGAQDGIEADGAIVIDDSADKDAAGVPRISLSSPAEPANKSPQIETEVEFANDPDVPFPFRGRRVNTKLAQVESVLAARPDETVLASSKRGPIWVLSKVGGVKHFRSALPLPHISTEENFNDVFNGECFLEMLVLLQFVREITANTAYQNAPLRAGFIIDDPNLHWPRYGFVDYREIIAHAQKENYHVSFATIPLDTWFTHAATADLFRANSQWLSLLIHGNDHAKKELARNYSEAMRKGLLQQAIQRIKRLERKTNIHVCRVMVPPHGACSDAMLAELSKCGFESACISTGSLRAHNQDKPWTKTLGFFPAEIIQDCPVLPRWGLTSNVKNSLLLAAYLGQPMILRGHHQDLKDGGAVFDEYARFINGLGNVFWSNMTDLSRLSYLWRMEGTTCLVKPLGRSIAFELPNEATKIVIESPESIDNCTWQTTSADGFQRKIMSGEHLLLLKEMGSKILIERAPPSSPCVKASLKPTGVPLILRRLLTEARDRLLVL
ncbi:hypothetical protein [Methylobacter tundripaludum]|uniref:Uncharacterized protein n=1 Tax=Methylobacter tundripaludum (strain ATCC BAA-1195 / DSM 17260 / SV96) TaxID=697282 RepID=G3J0M9_METTV|nr:hypothetical protein [Methylobacter tundripaludum]EGW20751.1 hypothetical protein Mettu_3900 [Methylobacter tundripaludum SV96]